MKYIEEIIYTNLDKNESCFVFPSEVVATFWRRKSSLYGKKAVLSDRFISWDKFKEDTFSLNMAFAPVNNHIRTLFTAALLEENRIKGNVFKGIIRPEHSEGSGSFLSWIISVLGEVKSFHESGLSEKVMLSKEIKKDLSFLYNQYIEFLADREMFEPSWVKADVSGINRDYFLFFTEVIEDFEDFSRDLHNAPSVYIVPDKEAPKREIKFFSSSVLELKWLLGEVGALLDRGVKVQDIAITLPEMDSWRIDLKAEALLRSIPLDFRQGMRLSEYPGGKMFGIIINCAKSGFTLPLMKQMLLNRSIPWKKRDLGEMLFTFGLEHHCFKNYRLQGKEVDLWANALNKLKEKQLPGYYKGLRSGIEKIILSKSFTELKSSVQIFISEFLDTSLWESDTLREFQFCLDTLNDLEDASERAGSLNYGSSCDIWLSAIADRIYVKRSDSPGISVFPYRVSAGADYKWHFIPGLSQNSSQVVKTKYRFLKENQRNSVPGLESDFTESFISLYSRSDGNILFSCSRDTFSGPGLPPSLFVLKGAVLEIKDSTIIKNDLYTRELGFWSGENSLPERIYSTMYSGADYALLNSFVKKDVDYTKRLLEDSHKKELVSEFTGETGLLHISPSSLDQYEKCPYLFMMERGLGLAEGEYTGIYLDHSLFGRIIHKCFDRFFEYIDASGSGFNIVLEDEYKKEMEQVVDSVFKSYASKGMGFIPPVWNYCRRFTRNKLTSFIEVEGVEFPGFKTVSIEKKYSSILEERGIELNGRIDRVSFKGDKTVIVDYKKKNHHKKGDMFTESGVPSTYQIPFYIYLMRNNGLEISSASYYDVTNCRYDHVYNPELKKAWCSEEAIEVLLQQLHKSVTKMGEKIRKGDFSVPKYGCSGCSFRRICRTKFHVR